MNEDRIELQRGGWTLQERPSDEPRNLQPSTEPERAAAIAHIHVERAKRVAKELKKVADIPLSRAQATLAHVYGFRNFHGLLEDGKSDDRPSFVFDEDLEPAELTLRRGYQAQRLRDLYVLSPEESHRFIEAFRPSARQRPRIVDGDQDDSSLDQRDDARAWRALNGTSKVSW